MQKNPSIQLIALDLDGTLLHEDKHISEYTLRILQELSERGYQLVPTTGRSLTGIPESILKIPNVRYAICSNGANLCNVQTAELIRDTAIPIETALKIIDYLNNFPLYLYLHTNKGTIRSTGWAESGLASRFPHIHFEENNVPDLTSYLLTRPVKIWKIGIFTFDTATFTALLEHGSPCSSVSMVRTGECNIELNSILASKGNGLAALCDNLHIPMSEVLAIGDNQNDISMLQLSGVSVAMGNAQSDVKKAADYTTKTNEEDGAAYFLEQYLLSKH